MSISLSIITITYNSSQLIEGLISDINKNTDNNSVKIEHIIVDNNSSDQISLKQAIIKAQKKYKNIKIQAYYRNKNWGFASSCNYGYRKSSGKVLLFLNPDTRLKKNSIATLINHSNLHNADISGCKILHLNTDNRIQNSIFNIPTLKTFLLEFTNLGKLLKMNSNFYINQELIKTDTFVSGVSGACLYIKREVFKKLNGFDLNYFMYLEDVDLCKRALDLEYKILYCPHSIIFHIGGASSDNKYRIHHQAWYDSRITYFSKHFQYNLPTFFNILFRIEEYLLKLRTRILSIYTK